MIYKLSRCLKCVATCADKYLISRLRRVDRARGNAMPSSSHDTLSVDARSQATKPNQTPRQDVLMTENSCTASGSQGIECNNPLYSLHVVQLCADATTKGPTPSHTRTSASQEAAKNQTQPRHYTAPTTMNVKPKVAPRSLIMKTNGEETEAESITYSVDCAFSSSKNPRS